jgi:hypothetical protein
VGRIFLSPAAPQDRRWMWQAVTTTRYPRGAQLRATREAAMAAFAKSRRKG